MNKKVIDNEIEIAYNAIKKVKIANEKGQVQKTFRGQITSFGASIMMCTLLSAIAFFFDSEKSSVDRKLLLQAIYDILKEQGKTEPDEEDLFEYAKAHGKEGKEEILNAAIALKLAMNLFELV